jgi:hypothetical protein
LENPLYLQKKKLKREIQSVRNVEKKIQKLNDSACEDNEFAEMDNFD